MVERQKKGSDFASNIGNMTGIGVCGSDRKIEITVGSPLRIKLRRLERTCVSDPAVQAKWHNSDHAETSGDGCFCHIGEVSRTANCDSRNKSSNVDQSRQN